MSVDRKTVEYIAGLAKLQLDETEKDALVGHLQRILGLVGQLDHLDLTDVPPTKHVIGLTNVERSDRAEPCLPTEEALANAPETDSDHFIVPRVLPD